MNRLLPAILVTLFSISGYAKSVEDSTVTNWAKIDQLLAAGKSDQVLILADSAYYSAKKNGNQVGMLRAEFYWLIVANDTTGMSTPAPILSAEQHIKEEHFPYNAIWQSITAQMYYNYFLAHRAEILDRPEVSRDIKIEDIDHWDADR